jgi:hypothetical protein
MASLICPGELLPQHFCGLSEIFEFTNADGKQRKFNCGQAAACTYLASRGLLKPDGAVMRDIEKAHPPDNLGGWFGTSRYCVERICRTHGLDLSEVSGEEELRSYLGGRNPVIVMLGVPGPRFWRWQLPAGHWMVAYGFDDEFVYLSNQGRMSWDEFRVGWKSLVPRLIRMNGRGLAVSLG